MNNATAFLLANQKELMATCMLLTTSNRADAKDLLQEGNLTILKLIEEGKVVEEMLNVSYFKKIIRNQFVDQYRKKTTRKNIVLVNSGFDERYMNVVIDDEQPELISLNEILSKVKKLKPNQIEIITARMNGVKYKDLAVQMNLSMSYLRSRYLQSRNRLKKRLTLQDFYAPEQILSK